MKRCPSCQSAFPTNYTHCPRDGSALAEANDWSEGIVVRGKYQIVGKVGQGGMAAVYKAVHVRFNEPRALKVINPELANDAGFVRRFEQEAIITRRLQHPNAVRVDDIDEAEDGRPFIVMEFVEGGNLKDVIEREAPLPVERVCSIVKQIAAALDAAHRLGLVHRDIKPANIALVGSADRLKPSVDHHSVDHHSVDHPFVDRPFVDHVKVLDFGIAKLKESHMEDSKGHGASLMTLTGTGMVIGTPTYMSPEQAKGLRGEELDGRSDIYSLGVVAYQMLTGDLPLKADSSLELLMAHITTPPRPIHEVRPDLNIPVAVADVVMRCLEKDRELRPASGRALIDELEFAERSSAVMPMRPAAQVSQAQVSQEQMAPQWAAESPALPTGAVPGAAPHSRMWIWLVAAVLIGGILGVGLYLLRTRLQAPVASTKSDARPSAPTADAPLAPAKVLEDADTRKAAYDALRSKDYAAALTLFQKLADERDAWGMSGLSSLYFQGLGVARDYDLAVQWARKAADGGDALGMNHLGAAYQQGHGVSQDYALAMQWYRKAADAGNASGMGNLGLLYQQGLGVTQDYALAMQWYRKAADAGSASSMDNLGFLYLRGLGVAQDYTQASQWFQKAAEAGEASGMNRLGVLYQEGHGVPKNYELALQWYRKAADAGNATAIYNLGLMYELGQGVRKDSGAAVVWYRKAAEAGNEDAKKRLQQLEKRKQ
jgi:TPR repeat protein/serine/threonine protein kinase